MEKWNSRYRPRCLLQKVLLNILKRDLTRSLSFIFLANKTYIIMKGRDKMGLLSREALEFLNSCNWKERNHKERMALIKLAKELYPDEDEYEED